jgi:predicted lipoprotein with Yx(FWY)xxD motif
MKNATLALALLASAILAGCSGGGGSSYGPVAPGVTTPATASALSTATIDGTVTFVNSASLPVYTFSADSTGASVCTASCLAAWPAVLAPSGTLAAGFTSFVRSDDGQTQLAYNGQPLYTFAGDSANAANGIGDVVPDNGASGASGTFELANASAAPQSRLRRP